MAKYEVDRFESPPDPDLVCCICQCVLHKPLESPCQHVFCQDCIETWLQNRKNCPNCRKSLRASKLKPVLPIVRNMINRLLIKCDNRDRGCREKVKLEYYDKHLKECGFVALKCMNTGCEETVLRKDMLGHEKQCNFRLVVCKKGCGMPISAEQEHSHNCIVVLKNNIKELEETHNKRYKQLLDCCKKLQDKVKNLEDKMDQALLPPHSMRDDYYSNDSYSVGGRTPTHEDLTGDDYNASFGYQSDLTPTSEVHDLEDAGPSDSYSDGRGTPINREEDESNWSWLNDDDNGQEHSVNSGDSANEETPLASDDDDPDSPSVSPPRLWREDDEQSDEEDDSSPAHGHYESSHSLRGATRSPQTDRPHPYSLRSADVNETEGFDEADGPSPAVTAAGRSPADNGRDSTRRGEHRDRPSDKSKRGSSTTTTTTTTTVQRRENVVDTGSDQTWTPTAETDRRQENRDRQETAASSSHNSRGAPDNSHRNDRNQQRRDRSGSREERRRHRSGHRRRPREDYSSDEDHSHHRSKHSSSKRSRRR